MCQRIPYGGRLSSVFDQILNNLESITGRGGNMNTSQFTPPGPAGGYQSLNKS